MPSLTVFLADFAKFSLLPIFPPHLLDGLSVGHCLISSCSNTQFQSSERPSRPPSVASHANSAYSFAGSTRHILGEMDGPLDPPSVPFFTGATDRGSFMSGSDVSLSVNYIPRKFSSSLLSSTTRKRKGKSGALDPPMPKRGGGVEAFRSGESRMPGEGDEDYDGVTGRWLGGATTGSKPKKLRWNKFKWILFIANILVCSFLFYPSHPPT